MYANLYTTKYLYARLCLAGTWGSGVKFLIPFTSGFGLRSSIQQAELAKLRP